MEQKRTSHTNTVDEFSMIFKITIADFLQMTISPLTPDFSTKGGDNATSPSTKEEGKEWAVHCFPVQVYTALLTDCNG